MNGHTLRDILQNENIIKGLGVANIKKKKTKENIVSFGHVKR